MTGKYYKVISTLWNRRLPDAREHGFTEDRDFRHTLWQMVDRWKGREGECVQERNGFMRIRFHDTPGGKPDEAWMPSFLLEETDAPPGDPEPSDGLGDELDDAFGFD